jgi:hypothetical protein
MTQLVAHEPSCLIPDGKLTADHESGYAPLIVTDQIGGEEPLTQIGAGLVEDGTGSDGVLMPTTGALIDTRTSSEMVCLGRLALVANKAIGPPEMSQGFDTGRFVFVLITERKKTRQCSNSFEWRLPQN